MNPLEKMQLHILRVTMQQYEQYHYDKEMLRKLANKLGQIEIESQCDLEHVRNMLNTKFEESISYPKVSQDWCFIDCELYTIFENKLCCHSFNAIPFSLHR